MAYCTYAEKEYDVHGRSIDDLGWDMTGMTLDLYRFSSAMPVYHI
jgi:hypothetical protein